MIDFFRPGIDAASQIDHILKAIVLKKARDALRAAGLDSTAPMPGAPVRASSPQVKSLSDTGVPRSQAVPPPRNDPQSFTKPLGSDVQPRPPQGNPRPGTPRPGGR